MTRPVFYYRLGLQDVIDNRVSLLDVLEMAGEVEYARAYLEGAQEGIELLHD